MMVKNFDFMKSKNYKKPQINADERKSIHLTGIGASIHHKASQHEALGSQCSLWLNTFSAPTHGRAVAPAIYSRSRRAEDEHFKGITEAYIEEQIGGNLKELE